MDESAPYTEGDLLPMHPDAGIRSRQLAQLARRMVSATQVVDASYKSGDPGVQSAQAKMEADMFRAELEYRQAYGKLKSLAGYK